MNIRELAVAGALTFAIGGAHAGLIDRGGGLIYDTDLNVTWLQDANYAKSSGYNADGLMLWSEADDWARNLNYSGLTGWRLPTTTDFGNDGCNWGDGPFSPAGTDCGYMVSPGSSEMAHLFHVSLGNNAYNVWPWASNEGRGLQNSGVFTNLQPFYYWSGTEYALDSATKWFFSFNTGLQRQAPLYENNFMYAWAVRDGDAALSVPEPATLALLGLGLGLVGLGIFRRKQ